MNEQHRLDPQNGIALNALHDKAFDRGLITFDTELRLVCSPSRACLGASSGATNSLPRLPAEALLKAGQ